MGDLAAGELDLVTWVRQRLEAVLEQTLASGVADYEAVWQLRQHALNAIELWNEVLAIQDLAHATLVAMPSEPGPLPPWPWTP